jgi:hypothetical protein
MYHADEVRPTAPGGGGRNVRPGGGEIEFYKGGPGVHVFTREERDRMNHNIDAAAQELARKWGNRPMNAAQLRALEEQRCRMAAAYNPDVVCR